MFASNDKKIEILNDHYKDTFSHLIRYRKQRDRLMLFLLAVLAVMYVFQFFPDETTGAISKLLSKKLGVEIVLNVLHVLLLPIFIVFILSHRYWQLWNLIERQYDYILALEKELSSLFMSGVPFTREINFAFRKNARLSIWRHTIYNRIFLSIWIFWIFLYITFAFRYYGFSWDLFIGFLIGNTPHLTYFYFYWRSKQRQPSQREQ